MKEESEKIIRGGEIVRLRHTELNEELTADIGYTGSLPEAYTRSYIG
jgi:hypothetical protein